MQLNRYLLLLYFSLIHWIVLVCYKVIIFYRFMSTALVCETLKKVCNYLSAEAKEKPYGSWWLVVLSTSVSVTTVTVSRTLKKQLCLSVISFSNEQSIHPGRKVQLILTFANPIVETISCYFCSATFRVSCLFCLQQTWHSAEVLSCKDGG